LQQVGLPWATGAGGRHVDGACPVDAVRAELPQIGRRLGLIEADKQPVPVPAGDVVAAIEHDAVADRN